MKFDAWLAHDMNGSPSADQKARPIQINKWYVLISFGHYEETHVFAGPFDTELEAEHRVSDLKLITR